MSLKDEVKRETKHKTVDSTAFLPIGRPSVWEQMSWLGWITPARVEQRVLIAARKPSCDIEASMSRSSCVSSLFALLP